MMSFSSRLRLIPSGGQRAFAILALLAPIVIGTFTVLSLARLADPLSLIALSLVCFASFIPFAWWNTHSLRSQLAEVRALAAFAGAERALGSDRLPPLFTDGAAASPQLQLLLLKVLAMCSPTARQNEQRMRF